MRHTDSCLAGIHACSCSRIPESEWSKQYTEDKFDAQERFWLGPRDPKRHVVYHMERDDTQQKWLATPDGTVVLDPNYSDYSIRIHDPKARSLSFIYRTICILPKSKLRAIYALIGEYINAVDKH
jgi:hypothetical protein